MLLLHMHVDHLTGQSKPVEDALPRDRGQGSREARLGVRIQKDNGIEDVPRNGGHPAGIHRLQQVPQVLWPELVHLVILEIVEEMHMQRRREVYADVCIAGARHLCACLHHSLDICWMEACACQALH